MFHQANIAAFSAVVNGKQTTTSLLAMWIGATLSQVTRYSSLPIRAFKHEDLAEMWLQREARDACGVDVQAGVSADSTIVSLTLVSSRNCRYAVTGVEVVSQAGVQTETYGPDTTTWVDLVAGVRVTLNLLTPIVL